MPTDILLAIERKRVLQREAAHTRRAGVLLIPLLMCLLSILLAIESHGFEIAVIETGLQATDIGMSGASPSSRPARWASFGHFRRSPNKSRLMNDSLSAGRVQLAIASSELLKQQSCEAQVRL